MLFVTISIWTQICYNYQLAFATFSIKQTFKYILVVISNFLASFVLFVATYSI